MLPNFLCVGAQKSATTTLWHLLNAHPDVCMARPRETRFFSEPSRFAEGLPTYEMRHFAHWNGERAVGEKCPEYLYLPEVPQRLHDAFGPDLRILICLRSPAQRAYSHYRHNIAQLRESRRFEDALEDEARNLANGILTAPPFGYIGRGLYAEQVKRYFDLFGRDNCLVMSFERLTQDQARAAQDVYAFLDLPLVKPFKLVHSGRPPLEGFSVSISPDGRIMRVRNRPSQPSTTRVVVKSLARRVLGRRDDQMMRNRDFDLNSPSTTLQDFVRRAQSLLPLAPALSRPEELRINRRHFGKDLDLLRSFVSTDVSRWSNDQMLEHAEI